jgi:uncharacterized membrane-anchored protein YjiN (DUF445 family)
VTSPAEQPPAQSEKRAVLNRARRNAALILVLAVALFIGARFLPIPEFWRHLLQAAGEAGTVGGLADWFAITALFRHPLGIPIPHTALIPRRKNDIGRSLAGFVERHFLDEALLIDTLRKKDRAQQIVDWFGRKETREILVDGIVANLQDFVRSGIHLEIVDLLLPIARDHLRKIRKDLPVYVGEETGRFVPSWVDETLADRLYQAAERFLRELGQHGSGARLALDREIRLSLEQIPANWREPVKRLVTELRDPEKIRLLGGGSAPREISDTVYELLSRTADWLARSPEVQDRINATLERIVIDYVAPFRSQIGHHIETVVANWDERQVTELIELQVGKDLQFIRINGTIIGALIGVGLFLIGHFMRFM